MSYGGSSCHLAKREKKHATSYVHKNFFFFSFDRERFVVCFFTFACCFRPFRVPIEFVEPYVLVTVVVIASQLWPKRLIVCIYMRKEKSSWCLLEKSNDVFCFSTSHFENWNKQVEKEFRRTKFWLFLFFLYRKSHRANYHSNWSNLGVNFNFFFFT